MKFTTRDRDNDLVSGNCAPNNGGWWYNSCSGHMELNDDTGSKRMTLNGESHLLSSVEIKIRSLNCETNSFN